MLQRTTPEGDGPNTKKQRTATMKIDGFDKFVALGKDNADAFAKSSAATVKAIEEIAKHQQALAAKSAEKFDAAVKALLAVKNPADLAELQSNLARDAIESTISEGRTLAELTTTAITAALAPFNAHVAALQGLVKTAA
jgi:phasin family protein